MRSAAALGVSMLPNALKPGTLPSSPEKPIVHAMSAAGETEYVRSRYDRLAPLYDILQFGMELRSRSWRRELWAHISDGEVLELGVGTGKNLPFYPPHANITGVDFSAPMLERAKRRAARAQRQLELRLADVEYLPFADECFDAVVTSFVFCSVPDPIRGLQEARRVLKTGGRMLMLEHVISEKPLLSGLMRAFDPLHFRIFGAHVARDTLSNVRSAGFTDVRSKNLALDIVRHIYATKG